MTGWLVALVLAIAAAVFAVLWRRAATPRPDVPPRRPEPPIEPYIGGMAHDFNNLFGIVIGNLDIAVAQNRDPTLHEPLKAALDTALRAAQINRRLHMVMRPQPQQQRVLVLDQWMPRLMGELGSIAGEQVRLTSDVAPGLAIRADPDLLLVAIQEILANAVEAMPQGGTVTFTVAADSPGMVRLAIVDQGGGMSAEARARAFEPFFTTRRGVRGSGLGLSLVHGYAERAGGMVALESDPNGTTVALLLPRAEATPKPDSRHGGASILVVEDNAAMRALAQTYLREFGYQAAAVENAEAALTLLRDGAAVDLLFADLVLPGVLDGRGLARAAMRLRPGLKCLLTTGGELTTLDDLPVLPKPYRKDDLARAVRACLGDRALSRVSGAVRELGLGTALLYLAGRALARSSATAALHDLLLYVQAAPARPMLPPHRGTSIEIRLLDGAAALTAGLPCPPDLRTGRQRPGVHCLAAYVQDRPIGHHWINLAAHDDEMVRCRYEPWPAERAAWSFDLLIAPAHRGGLAYARLMDASWAFLRQHGRDRLASYIAATNRGAIGAEARLGGRCLGRAVHLRLGPLQLLVSSLRPFLHLSFSDRGRPVQRLGLEPGETA